MNSIKKLLKLNHLLESEFLKTIITQTKKLSIMTDDQKTLASVAGLIVIFGICSYLIAIDVVNYFILIPVVIGCYPLFKIIVRAIKEAHIKVRRRTMRALKKINATIESSEYNEKGRYIEIVCEYKGEKYIIKIVDDATFIVINSYAFGRVDADDPRIPQILEVLNQINEHTPQISLTLMQPVEGMRAFYTTTLMIVPAFFSSKFIGNALETLAEYPNYLSKIFNGDFDLENTVRYPIYSEIDASKCYQ